MKVFFGARLFDGDALLEDHALVVEDGVFARSSTSRSGRAAASRSISAAAFSRPA